MVNSQRLFTELNRICNMWSTDEILNTIESVEGYAEDGQEELTKFYLSLLTDNPTLSYEGFISRLEGFTSLSH
jgi:hypothetical protein